MRGSMCFRRQRTSGIEGAEVDLLEGVVLAHLLDREFLETGVAGTRNLQLDHEDALAVGRREKLLEAGDAGVLEAVAVLRREVEGPQLGEGVGGHPPRARREPVHGEVVEDHERAVRRHLAVHVHAVELRGHRHLRADERVVRRVVAEAAVAEDQGPAGRRRIGPEYGGS